MLLQLNHMISRRRSKFPVSAQRLRPIVDPNAMNRVIAMHEHRPGDILSNGTEISAILGVFLSGAEF